MTTTTTTKKSTTNYTSQTSIIPKKSLGQNFLTNPRLLDKIVAAAEITNDDTVLEIGPGKGSLTTKIAEKAGKVIAVEKDHRLIPELKERFKNHKNIDIVEGDILQRCPLQLQRASLQYKVIGNIPYYITSHLLKTIFESWPMPKLIVFTIQKEVAQRIIAKPPNMSLLAVSVQYYAETKIMGYISRKNFRPVPNVDSAIIKITPRNNSKFQVPNSKFFKVVKAGFSNKRKMLVNNLSREFDMIKEDILQIFDKVALGHSVRAEELSIEKWGELAKHLLK